MALTAEQRKAREHRFTASVAPIVMSGDEEKLLRLWREMIGEVEPENLDDVWAVQLGSFLETFILDWHQRKTGWPITERGRVVQHRGISYVCATLDGWRAHDDCTLDAKVCNAWQSLDSIVAYYTPQCVVQRECKQAARCALLIQHGTAEPREIEIQRNPDYERELWSRIASFWMCVEALVPPVPLPRCVPPDEWRTVDLTQEPKPNWANPLISELQVCGQYKEAADLYAHASDVAKSLIPPDVGCVRWLHITVKRDRRGYLSIKAA